MNWNPVSFAPRGNTTLPDASGPQSLNSLLNFFRASGAGGLGGSGDAQTGLNWASNFLGQQNQEADRQKLLSIMAQRQNQNGYFPDQPMNLPPAARPQPQSFAPLPQNGPQGAMPQSAMMPSNAPQTGYAPQGNSLLAMLHRSTTL